MSVNFFQDRQPPEKRRAHCPSGLERHLTEGGVMVAFALHLLERGAKTVEIHPDGEHGKRFDIRACLEDHGFALTAGRGSTTYGGIYERGDQQIIVSLTPGVGDVCGKLGIRNVIAECKGGVTNTRHAGQVSRLRKHLCEAIGLLLSRPAGEERQIAVVPASDVTAKLATLMARRAKQAGIEIALVNDFGNVTYIEVESG